MRLIDTHAHLQAVRFDADRLAVAAAAREAGVERMLIPGWDVASSASAVALLADLPWASAAAGVHPHAAHEVDDAGWERIVALCALPDVRAVGETGLDYDRAFAPRDAQLANLRRHLALARDTGKPAILHCRSAKGMRDAQDDLIAELRAAGVGDVTWRATFSDRAPALLHSFSGPVDYAAAALELGLAVSISGLAFRHGEEVTAEVVRLIPTDRLLVETDSPYLPAPGAPKRRNDPRYVGITARWVAEQRGDDPEGLGDRLVSNHDAIFGPQPIRPALERS